MPRYVESQGRQQVTLLPECLDDFIGEDNPVRVIDAFVAELNLGELGFDRTVFLPTRAVSLRQLEDSMKKVVTNEARRCLGKVVYQEDQQLSNIVASFPTKVDSRRALALGAPRKAIVVYSA